MARFYNPDAPHYKIVWPIGVPGVSTALWYEGDWLNYAMMFRPAGYTGGEFDTVAFQAWLKGQELERLREEWPGLIVTLADDGNYKLERK